MRRTLPSLAVLAIAALLALPAAAFALEEHALLTSSGTLHTVRAGRAVDLGLENLAQSPENNIVEWTAVSQDGTTVTSIIPGTDSSAVKRGIDAAFDEQTQTLVLLWTEDNSGYTQIRVGVEREGAWTNSGLLPNQGISKAFNPRMVISHQPVFHLDENDAQVWTTRSTLAIVWWEEAQIGQARPGHGRPMRRVQAEPGLQRQPQAENDEEGPETGRHPPGRDSRDHAPRVARPG